MGLILDTSVIVRAERRITLPFEDLLIGATALQLGFALATHNARDFERIPDLIVREP